MFRTTGNIHYSSVIIFSGGPGSGKGTQCAKIVEHFSLTHLSAGELLREEVKQNSERAALIAEFIKDGKIVPHV
jgi:UMP-CMP kinase